MNHIYTRKNMIRTFYWIYCIAGNATNRRWWRHEWYQPTYWGASKLRLIQEEYPRPLSSQASVWSSMVVACKMLVFLSSPLPYPRCQLWFRWFRTPLAGCGAHAGRCCPATTATLSCWFQNVSYAPGWCGILPFWPTHPDARMYDSETMR